MSEKPLENEVAEYIKVEKEIAQFNISRLARQKSPTNKRLLEIEQEFINIPFEEMGFSNREEISEAIKLYRESRSAFYLKFRLPHKEESKTPWIRQSLNLLQERATYFMNEKVEQANVIQNDKFFKELVEYEACRNKSLARKEEDRLAKLGINDMLKIEPLLISRKRARYQLAYYSLGRVIHDFTQRFLHLDIEKISINKSKEVVAEIKNFLLSLDVLALQCYNEGVGTLQPKIAGTLGANNHIEKSYHLRNLLEDYSLSFLPITSHQSFSQKRPQVGYIQYGQKDVFYTNSKRDAERETKNRAYGIFLPVERIGYEKMKMLYKEIYFNGQRIDHLFSDSISNVRANKDGEIIHVKALMMKPFWEVLKTASVSDHSFLSKLMAVDTSIVDFTDTNVAKKINSAYPDYIGIDLHSKVLVAQTRTEEDAFEEVMAEISDEISKIRVEVGGSNDDT